ncbi:hypothetical protein [uncultured Bacteroides sp.]|uniref:hypothetical protein n=1 Tax=uncultured Bacteroides sp. TaxID=162156 RepID=UPI002AAC0AE3|nr:hypothetical protein [uncultured Bacteroides sp.]
MVKNYLKKCLVSLFVSSFLFASCVDQGYDLSKDINLAIHIGGDGLALPVGSTDSIKLSKIIKVDESDVLHLNGGEYSLMKKDTIDPAVNVSIPSASDISIPTITWESSNLYTLASLSTRASRRSSLSMELPVPATSWNLALLNEDMPTEVKSIKTITPKNGGVDATIALTLTGVTSAVGYVFNDLELVFPDFIVSPQLTNHKLILNGSTKVVQIKITSFDFSNEPGGALAIKVVNGKRTLSLSKPVTFSGAITVSGLSASTGDVKLKATVQIPSVAISEVDGKVDPSINVNIKPISLDIPEFLEDDKVELDVLDPMIRLNVTNETAVPIIIDGSLKGYRNETLIRNITVKDDDSKPITIGASGNTIICLSRTGKSGPAESVKYKIDSLNYFIQKIPDQIKFTMNAHADQSTTHKIKLGANYKVKIGYAVEVPFRFGPGLAIVYNDTIDEINKSIKDLDVKKVTINTTIENNIPLNLQLQVTPVGIDKKPITDINVEVKGENGNTSGIIQSCDKDGKTQESPITIELTETTSGAIKKLDGLLLKITAKSTETVNGMPLKDTQYIRLKNIKAKASGGMNIDLNDK